MIQSLVKDSLSYFRPFGNYFVLIYGFFLAFPTREIFLVFYPDDFLLRILTQLLVSAAVAIAILWGTVTTRLYVYPESFSVKKVLKEPLRSAHLYYILYLLPMITVLLAVWLASPIASADALYLSEGLSYRSVVFNSWFLELAVFLVVAFIMYPLLQLFHLRAQLRDREVRYSLRLIASCFGAIAAALLSSHVLTSFGYSIIGIGHLFAVVLLSITVQAFRKPSFLKSFLGVLPSFDLTSSRQRGNQTVMIYSTEEEKFQLFSKFLIDALNSQDRAVYFYQGSEPLIRERLSQNGLQVDIHAQNHNLTFVPFEALYGQKQPGEYSAPEYCQKLEREARIDGKGGIKILIDYKDAVARPIQIFLDHLTDERWYRPDLFMKVLMALERRAFHGQENGIAMLKEKLPVLDLLESNEIFSRMIGLSHKDLSGRKILFEFDPLSEYERMLRALIAEVTSNLERAIVLTRSESPIHECVRDERGLKMFIITSRVSTPQTEREDHVLLPVYNSSLLVDALNKTIEAYNETRFSVIVDNISHFIFTIGADKTYLFVRQALELMGSGKITAVFLLNSKAHDERTLSTYRSLFEMDLACNAGSRAPEIKKGLPSISAR